LGVPPSNYKAPRHSKEDQIIDLGARPTSQIGNEGAHLVFFVIIIVIVVVVIVVYNGER
jgi:hypothetical protein